MNLEETTPEVIAGAKKGLTERRGHDTPSPQEIDARVRRLTAVATNLFHRGSYEPAFESLMKAYLLDPTSPHVVACETALHPALEMMRARRTLVNHDSTSEAAQNPQLATFLQQQKDPRLLPATATAGPAKNSPGTDPAEVLRGQRVDALRQRLEQTKKEREQQIWRNASSPPKAASKSVDAPSATQSPDPQDVQGGLLAKLKEGKFFG